jgi:hypothetical protein
VETRRDKNLPKILCVFCKTRHWNSRDGVIIFSFVVKNSPNRNILIKCNSSLRNAKSTKYKVMKHDSITGLAIDLCIFFKVKTFYLDTEQCWRLLRVAPLKGVSIVKKKTNFSLWRELLAWSLSEKESFRNEQICSGFQLKYIPSFFRHDEHFCYQFSNVNYQALGSFSLTTAKQFLYCCAYIRCHGNVFTTPYPSNDRLS